MLTTDPYVSYHTVYVEYLNALIDAVLHLFIKLEKIICFHTQDMWTFRKSS